MNVEKITNGILYFLRWIAIDLSIMAIIGFLILKSYYLLSINFAESNNCISNNELIAISLIFGVMLICFIILLWVKKELYPEELRKQANYEKIKLMHNEEIDRLKKSIEELTNKLDKEQDK